MAWVAVNWNGDEYIYEKMPERFYNRWGQHFVNTKIECTTT